MSLVRLFERLVHLVFVQRCERRFRLQPFGMELVLSVKYSPGTLRADVDAVVGRLGAAVRQLQQLDCLLLVIGAA